MVMRVRILMRMMMRMMMKINDSVKIIMMMMTTMTMMILMMMFCFLLVQRTVNPGTLAASPCLALGRCTCARYGLRGKCGNGRPRRLPFSKSRTAGCGPPSRLEVCCGGQRVRTTTVRVASVERAAPQRRFRLPFSLRGVPTSVPTTSRPGAGRCGARGRRRPVLTLHMGAPAIEDSVGPRGR